MTFLVEQTEKWVTVDWWSVVTSKVQVWIPADRISVGWESQIKNLVSSPVKSADSSAENVSFAPASHYHYLDSALCGCFPALSRKGSGSQGQVSTRPLLGGSKVLSEAVGPTGHAVRAHQSSHPLIRLQYFQHSLPGGKKNKKSRVWLSHNSKKTGTWTCDCHVTKKPLRIKLWYVVAVTITKCQHFTWKQEKSDFVCCESIVVFVVYLNQN